MGVGYPRLFPRSQKDVTGCGWLSDAKRAALNVLDASLDTAIRRAAGKARVSYLDITNALAGHEACTKDSWIYRISAVDKLTGMAQQDGHPLPAGQAAIARLVAGYLTQRFYR